MLQIYAELWKEHFIIDNIILIADPQDTVHSPYLNSDFDIYCEYRQQQLHS